MRNDSKPDFNYEAYCLLDLLIPSWLMFHKGKRHSKPSFKYRKYFFLVFLLILVNAVAFSLIWLQDGEIAISHYTSIFSTALVAEFLIIAYIYSSKKQYKDNAHTLYQQIGWFRKSDKWIKEDGSSKKEFYKWYYKEHIKPMYGFIFRNGKHLKMSFKKDALYLFFMLMFVIVWTFVSIFAPNIPLHGTKMYVGHILNSIIFWTLVSYVLRIIIRSVQIISDYSDTEKNSWKLSPPFSCFNNSGFDFLIRIWRKMMIYFLFFWILFWIYTSINYDHSIFYDTLYVSSAVFLVGLWSIRTSVRTFMFSKKIQKASLKDFEETILNKRDDFCKDLTQTSFFDLNKALETIKKYEKIMFKNFKTNYIIAVLLNLWVIMIPVVYWLNFCVLHIIVL